MTDDLPVTRAEILETIEDLAAMGLIRDSGRRRGGQIVWVVTELGRLHGRDILKGAMLPAAAA